MERRPELLSSVMLRQNPHAVHEWHKRVKLFEGNPTRQILTYTEAVKTVDSDKVTHVCLSVCLSGACMCVYVYVSGIHCGSQECQGRQGKSCLSGRSFIILPVCLSVCQSLGFCLSTVRAGGVTTLPENVMLK